MNQNEWKHSSEKQVLSGTLTMDEIRQAVKKGRYTGHYELWEYEVASYV